MNQNRRNLLKIILFGGILGIFSKLFGKETLDFFAGRKEDTVDKKNFANFQIEESGDELKVFSNAGEELFIIDNER